MGRRPLLVNGRLLKHDMAASMDGLAWRDPQAVFAAARFQVARSGRVTFRVSGIKEAAAWVDAKACSFNSDFQTELDAGTHTLYVKLNAKNLPDSIRVESPRQLSCPIRGPTSFGSLRKRLLMLHGIPLRAPDFSV